jgi:microsomal dipeptidase-like Zn-dependent dipeptidase
MSKKKLQHSPAVALAEARELHEQVPVIDTHSHFLLAGHYLSKNFYKKHKGPRFWNPLRNTIDFPRIREAKVTCPVFTVYVPIFPLRISAWKACCRIIETFNNIVEKNPNELIQVDNAQSIRTAQKDKKIAGLLGVEGGHVIGKKIERLAILRKSGVRILTLTHFIANRICDAHVGPRIHKGLSEFGREVVLECERQGIVVDLAHATKKAFYDVLECSSLPPVVTHGAMRHGKHSDRYMSKEQVKDLAQKGGAIGVILWPWYLERHGVRIGLDKVADHYARLADLVGCDSLMIGTDMDGFIWLPQDMKDVSCMPLLTAKLMERGFSKEELIKILGGNFLKILEGWEK